jgi:hypothetical protein
MKVRVFSFSVLQEDYQLTHEMSPFMKTALLIPKGSYFLPYQYMNDFHHKKPTSISYERFVEILKDIFSGYSEPEQDAIVNYVNKEYHSHFLFN